MLFICAIFSTIQRHGFESDATSYNGGTVDGVQANPIAAQFKVSIVPRTGDPITTGRSYGFCLQYDSTISQGTQYTYDIGDFANLTNANEITYLANKYAGAGSFSSTLQNEATQSAIWHLAGDDSDYSVFALNEATGNSNSAALLTAYNATLADANTNGGSFGPSGYYLLKSGNQDLVIKKMSPNQVL